MISRNFVKLWEPQYDTQKYPLDFYRLHSASARSVEQPMQFKEDLLALLHWKDGKAIGFERGKYRAKPNIQNPILRLTNDSLTNLKWIFQDLAQAENSNVIAFTENLRERLSQMWRTVVIPSFLLNVARPDRFPIIDQHTARAFLALTSGKVVEKPLITWEFWKDYVNFFQCAVETTDYNHNAEKRCYVDRALFAWGKSLKKGAAVDNTPPTFTPSQKTHPCPREENYDTSSPKFKNLVLRYLQKMKQVGAMKRAANELGMNLPPSYLQYPGSHIFRWRKQGYPR